ncbi:putative cell division protein YtgP [Paraliobacillus sp. PM-2]|uniref:putative polysaccharide biosynthesis protein n=1 Tax=Paraliobacillus sp. PM-2 TaxID=1462524 RepID=UPI00061CC1B5|nr:polysaccharide biosynthesis protein [Paraliobacillus sp. PM-2]CQR47475.1 putative cell division protein YtgP [Paraliobacillus sp. PM-2]
MTQEKSNKQFFQGAFVLTLAGIISKVLSAGYRIPLQNITGDTGFYIYQQIYPFLGMAMMLALYGFPTAISKIIAEKKDNGLFSSDFYRIFSITTFFSVTFVLLIVGFAPYIAAMMGDPALIPSVRMVALVFLTIPFVSSYRGLFQGLNNMKPTAFSQITEQLLRVCIIIGVSLYVVYQNQSLYYIGIGGAIASTVGTLGASIVLYVFLKKKQVFFHASEQASVTWNEAVRSVLGFGLVITINHMLLLLLQFVDAFTLVSGLIHNGFTLSDAKIWKGIFDRGQPLVQLGIVVGSSLALAFIPTITTNRLNKRKKLFLSYIRSAWKFSLYLSAGATIGLITLFPHVNQLLFLSNNGTKSLQLLSLTIIFAALSITTASILQGLGYMYRTAGFVLLGIGCKCILNVLFVPRFGITGAALATTISACIVLLCNLYQLKVILNKQIIRLPWFRFLCSLGGMTLVLLLLNKFVFPIMLIQSRVVYAVYLLLVVLVGAGIYFFLLIRLRAFTKGELEVLPFQNIVGYLMKEDKYEREY